MKHAFYLTLNIGILRVINVRFLDLSFTFRVSGSSRGSLLRIGLDAFIREGGSIFVGIVY